MKKASTYLILIFVILFYTGCEVRDFIPQSLEDKITEEIKEDFENMLKDKEKEIKDKEIRIAELEKKLLDMEESINNEKKSKIDKMFYKKTSSN